MSKKASKQVSMFSQVIKAKGLKNESMEIQIKSFLKIPDFGGDDFSYERLEGIPFKSQYFVDCNFDSVTFDECEFNDCVFKNCNFSGSTFTRSQFKDTRIYESNLSGSTWDTLLLNGLEFIDTPTSDTEFTNCTVVCLNFNSPSEDS